MFSGNYKFAGHTVCIQSVYDEIQRMCVSYRSEVTPEATITISEGDILAERDTDQDFSRPYLETLAVYRKLATLMLDWKILLFHASAVAVDNRCYLFTALSGTGKSTHVRLWRQLLGDRVVMVNDDKPLLGITPQGITVFGTPWDGKHHLSSNIAVPLQAVCLVTRGDTNSCQSISPNDILEQLLHQIFIPKEPMKRFQALALLDEICRQVPFYKLQCNMELEAAEVSYRAMAPQTIEDMLRFEGMLMHGVKGVSMEPMLRQGRDMVVIEPSQPVHPLDVVLFKRKNGAYVLHRVTAIHKDSYEITGDNCLAPETVYPDQILGVMTHFIRKGKKHSIDEPAYQRYVRLWTRTYAFRKIFNLESRILHKLKRMVS